MRYFMSASLFNITPTLFEIALVCGILTHNFGASYAAVALGTVGTYAVFTTQVRVVSRIAGGSCCERSSHLSTADLISALLTSSQH